MPVASSCITCRGKQDRKASGEKIDERAPYYTRSDSLNTEDSTTDFTDGSRTKSSSRSESSSRSGSSYSRSSYLIIVMLRLLAATGVAIAALSGLGNLLVMSLVSSLLLATVAVRTTYSDPNSWMHTLPLLISTVSKRAGLVAYYGLRLMGVVMYVVQDMLLAVFFAVAIGMTREIIVYYW